MRELSFNLLRNTNSIAMNFALSNCGINTQKKMYITKTVVRDEEGHYIILKGSIQQEDLTIRNIYAPNVGAAI